jgi:hypothetical protein
VPGVPSSHPFVERLIGTIRREFLDQVLFWNAHDLERKLTESQTYYQAARRHASLEGHTPSTFADGQTEAPADLNHECWALVVAVRCSSRAPRERKSRPTVEMAVSDDALPTQPHDPSRYPGEGRRMIDGF